MYCNLWTCAIFPDVNAFISTISYEGISHKLDKPHKIAVNKRTAHLGCDHLVLALDACGSQEGTAEKE